VFIDVDLPPLRNMPARFVYHRLYSPRKLTRRASPARV
jgi:hypothetical protein